MKSLKLLLTVLLLVTYSFISYSEPDAGEKVTICHIPPGNPSNAHEITVSINAMPAHMAHGDQIGACDPCVVDPEHPDCQ